MATDRPASAEVVHFITHVRPQHVVKKVGGRKSWLYSGRLGSREVFVKVEVQDESRQSEIDIMQKLLDDNVPHTARMLHGFRLDSHNGFRTEAMILEHHGQPLCKFFSYLDSRRRLNQDTVSAVVRQIITALFGAYRARILHRDVSIGNIVARLRGCEVEATLIDWGYARLESASHHPNSNPNNDATVGTMAFRSLRVVNGCLGRTIIDDIESVFYVVCYGLVYVYAKGCLGNDFWDMSRKDPAGYRAMTLDKFPRLVDKLFGDSSCPVDSGTLKVLEDLHEVLFRQVDVDDVFRSKDRDPREELFPTMMAAICSKFGLDSAVLDLGSSTLEGPNAIRRVSGTPVKQTYQ
ncbi:hypothetical protein EV182_006348, partial [Spiromyces aspiralis]